MTEYRNHGWMLLLVVLLAACGAPDRGLAATAPPPQPAADCAPPPPADVTRRDGWLGLLAARPDDVAFVVDTGRGPVVSHGADRPMPVASAVKVVHLAAYGRAVAEGRIRPDEPIAMADWERWYLPTDGGAHQAALARLRPGATVTVDQVVEAMIRESDNAATDWLRDRLGDDALVRAAADAGWAPFDLPSELGAAIALVLPDRAPPLAAPRSERGPAEVALARRYAADPAFRVEVARALEAAVTNDLPGYLRANEEWASATSTASAAQLVGVYRALATGWFGPGSDVAQRHLEYQPPQPRGRLGFKGGSFTTVLTFGAWLRRPDGTIGYTAILARAEPRLAEPRALAAQQRLVLEALDDPRRLAALACVA